jgi:Raf kinase inhibitor-like YbhB/YbcL family protein
MARVTISCFVLTLLVAFTLAGCGPGGTPEPSAPPQEATAAPATATLPPSEPTAAPNTPTPPPSEPTPAPEVEETPSATSTPEPPMEISSTAFEDQGEIPPRHALCPDQANLSPPVDWSHVPPATESLALVCVDSAVGFVHWTIYNIPPSATGLIEGVPQLGDLGDGSLQGPNDYGEVGYGGPCPPPGAPHEYVFTLYALDTTLDLPAGADADTVLQAAEDHIIVQAQVTGLYALQ